MRRLRQRAALQDIHTAMRSGTTTNAHLTALNARHVGSGTPGVPHSLDDPRLNNAHVSVIVFRNEVRTFIEADLIARQAAATGQQLLSWPIEVRACAGVASRIHSLPHRGFYFRGMRVVFLHRVNVELGIVKNNMGTLVDIALDPREPPLAHSPCVELLNAPRGVYVAVDGCAQQVVDGRPPGVVYIAACAVQGQGVRATMLPYRSIATITDFGAQALTFRPPAARSSTSGRHRRELHARLDTTSALHVRCPPTRSSSSHHCGDSRQRRTCARFSYCGSCRT